MINKKGYTLLEVILSMVIFSMLITTIISIYMNVKQADGSVAGKRELIAEASDLFDKIHEAAIDYSIDYEEYFNRRGLGYGIGSTGFSSYGNSGERYYCSGGLTSNSKRVNNNYYVYGRDNTNKGCFQSGKNQKYGEYNFQHRKLNNTDKLNDIANSGSYMGDGPIAISPNTGLEYLYLISNDKTERYYFRRIEKVLWNNKTGGTIQMLKLRGFDAGDCHNFSCWGAYDGFIDTRACDISQGFVCSSGILVETGGYKMPTSYYDGWIDVTSDKVNVMDFKVDIMPTKDPYLARSGNQVMDPFAKISITMGIAGNEETDVLTLSTTLSLKYTYSDFVVTSS